MRQNKKAGIKKITAFILSIAVLVTIIPLGSVRARADIDTNQRITVNAGDGVFYDEAEKIKTRGIIIDKENIDEIGGLLEMDGLDDCYVTVTGDVNGDLTVGEISYSGHILESIHFDTNKIPVSYEGEDDDFIILATEDEVGFPTTESGTFIGYERDGGEINAVWQMEETYEDEDTDDPEEIQNEETEVSEDTDEEAVTEDDKKPEEGVSFVTLPEDEDNKYLKDKNLSSYTKELTKEDGVAPEDVEPTDGNGGLSLLGVTDEDYADTKDETVTLDQFPRFYRGALKESANTLMSGPLKVSSLPTQTPVTGDGITIEKVLVRWLSASTGETESARFDDLVLRPETDTCPNQQWQIDFALSGKGYLDAGSVEIVIPAYIWKDRDGKEPGRLTLAIPEDPDNSQEFAWRRVGDTIVITNTRKISAATKYMIQGTFRMTYPDPNSDKPFTTTPVHQMVDIDTTDENAEFKGISNEFFATINVITPSNEELLTMESNMIKATIDTGVTASSATKKAVGSVHVKDIPNDIPAEFLPQNPDDYYYVQWYVDGTAEGNQPFSMEVSDTVADEYDGIMLGITDANEESVRSDDGESVSAALYNGYSTDPKACYVWTAYPKSAFTGGEGESYTLHNTHTITVTGADDGIATKKEASAEISFRAPITWKIDKVWDYNEALYDTPVETIMERRPDDLNVWVENKSKEGNPTAFSDTLNDANEWHTEWTDDGSVSNYEAYEHSYTVSRNGHMPGGSSSSAIVSGYTDWTYNDDGTYTRRKWWYDREKTVYDEATHTWTFYNCYHEATENGRIAELSMQKHATNHLDNNVLSTGDKDLQLLRDESESTTITYDVSTSTRSFELTRDPEKETWDMSGHGKNYVELELIDHDEYLEARHLSEDEYYFSYVQMRPASIYDWVPDGEGETTGVYSEVGTVPVTLYGLTDGVWVKYATLSDDGSVTTENGAENTGLKVKFPEGVTKVKEDIRTNGARADLSYDVGIILKPSDDILTDVGKIFDVTDYGMARSFNYATVNLYSDAKTDLLMTLTRYDATYLHGRNYKVAEDLDKTSTFTENNRSEGYLRFENKVTLNQQSNITIRKYYEEAVETGEIPMSESGTFYDLLPPGMQADLDTVTITNGSVRTVDIIDNYKDSGRQLLIIKADLSDTVSARGYEVSDEKRYDATYPNASKQGEVVYGTMHTVTFDSIYSYEEARNRGLQNLRNHAAYEADEEILGNAKYWSGEADDVSGDNHKETLNAVTESVRDLMRDLDGKRDDKNFVYAGANMYVTETDFSALTDLKKHVSITGSDNWTYGHDNDVNVYEGGKYSYRISIASGTDTTTKDIILLDSIEYYTPMEITSGGDTDLLEGSIVSVRELEYKNSELSEGQTPAEGKPAWKWKGSFLSIDVSEMEAQGVVPVVYYNTRENLNIEVETYNPDQKKGAIEAILNDPSSGWTTTLPDDPSTVHAIAIDCRKAADGSDFELEDGNGLIAYMHMKAPTYATWPEAFDETDYFDHLKNAHAYNNVFMDITQVDDVGGQTHSYDHFDFTKVGIMGFDLDVEKSWDDMDDNDSIRPDSVTVHLYQNGRDTGRELVLDNAGNYKGKFEHVLRYDDDGNMFDYSLVEDEVNGYQAFITKDNTSFTILNKHEPEKINIPATKEWESAEPDGWEKNIPSSIKVRLNADGKYTGKQLTIRPDKDGNWSGIFTGLYKYDKGREIEYSIEEVPVTDFVTTYDGYKITNTYYPYGDLNITKSVANGTKEALKARFSFSIVLTDKNNDPVTGKYPYEIKDSTGSSVKTGRIGNGGEFSLKDGETIHVSDIPSGTRYRITEGQTAGFTLTKSTKATGTIRSEDEQTASFTNTYHSFGTAEVDANKCLTGHLMSRFQFRFEIFDETGQMIRTQSNAADGSVTFGGISYTEADDGKMFYYILKETDRGRPGYTYDDKIYYITVEPHDNGDGTMTCDKHIYEKDEEEESETPWIFDDPTQGGFTELTGGDIPTFENAYHAQGSVELKAWKDLVGRDLLDGEFSFVLKDMEGNILQTKTNAEDGAIAFDALSFDETDIGKTYYYYVREVEGDDETVNYDTHSHAYKITVYDNGDGTLSFEQGVSKDGIAEVIFNANGGKFENGDGFSFVVYENTGNGYTPKTGEVMTDAPPVTPGDDYAFLGWYEDGIYDAAHAYGTADIHDNSQYYAVWKAPVTITFDVRPEGMASGQFTDSTTDPKTITLVWDTENEQYQVKGTNNTIDQLNLSGYSAAQSASGKNFTGWQVHDTEGILAGTQTTPMTVNDASASAVKNYIKEQIENGETSVMFDAVYEAPKLKYAVSLYGIGTDIDKNGNTMGLTFGPAVGANYINSLKRHTPTGETALGNAHRCIHDDDWNTIVYWNKTDPDVYEQCIAEGCTHSVELDTSAAETLFNENFAPTYTGDGPSVLFYELVQSSSNYENLRWHPNGGTYGTNSGGWGATRIRAMLNGADDLTDVGISNYSSYASSDVNKSASVYDADNCLFAAFPTELQDAIGERAVKYDSEYNSKTEANLKTSYDKLWLLSPNEIWSESQNTTSWATHPLEGSQYPYFAAKSNMSGSSNSQVGTRGYYVNNYNGGNGGSSFYWWLRASYGYYNYYALCVVGSGNVYNDDAYDDYGVSPCFTLSR